MVAYDDSRNMAIYLEAPGKREENERVFFKIFPGNFKEFEKLYRKESIGIEETVAPVYFFCNNIKYISDTLYYAKLIHLCTHARYYNGDEYDIYAEAILALQGGIQDHFTEKLDLAIYSLKKYSKRNVYRFWLFYFADSIDTNPGVYEVFLNDLKPMATKAPALYKTMFKARKAIIAKMKKEEKKS